MAKDRLDSMRHDTPGSRPTLTECEACLGSRVLERDAGGPGTYLIMECHWCGGAGCFDSVARTAYREWVSSVLQRKDAMTDDEVRSVVEKFSRLLEDRIRVDRGRGAEAQDAASVLTGLFEAVHDAKTALQGGGSVSAQAVKIAAHALRLAVLSDGIEEAVRRDSMLLVNASTDHVRDATGRNAVMIRDKCVLWGAVVESDVELTEPVLQSLKPAIRDAMQALHSSGVQAKRVVVQGGFVRAYPSETESDPRMTVNAIPVPIVPR